MIRLGRAGFASTDATPRGDSRPLSRREPMKRRVRQHREKIEAVVPYTVASVDILGLPLAVPAGDANDGWERVMVAGAPRAA